MIKKANKLSLNVPPNIIAKNGADNVKAVITDKVEYLFLDLISFIFLKAYSKVQPPITIFLEISFKRAIFSKSRSPNTTLLIAVYVLSS